MPEKKFRKVNILKPTKKSQISPTFLESLKDSRFVTQLGSDDESDLFLLLNITVFIKKIIKKLLFLNKNIL